MAELPSDVLRGRLEELRWDYVCATLRQRFGVAHSRCEHPDLLANRLVQVVSAAEGCARSVLLVFRCRQAAEQDPSQAPDVERIYRKIKHAVPENLIAAIATHLASTPEEMFGADEWALFGVAVTARNLVVHECTGLNQGDASVLIGAAEHVLTTLEEAVAKCKHLRPG